MGYSEKVTTQKQILIAQDTARSLPCTVSKTGVTANADGDYVVKAGTPLYGADLGASRLTTSYTISASGASGSETKALGVLYQDIYFDKGATTASGTIVYDGSVDYLKLDNSVQTFITTAVKTALPNIQFINGRED